MRIFAWRSGRQVLLNHALLEGYSLLETFDVVDNPIIDDSTYAAIEALVRHSSVSALLLCGVRDIKRAQEISASSSIRMLAVPMDPLPTDAGTRS